MADTHLLRNVWIKASTKFVFTIHLTKKLPAAVHLSTHKRKFRTYKPRSLISCIVAKILCLREHKALFWCVPAAIVNTSNLQQLFTEHYVSSNICGADKGLDIYHWEVDNLH
jgi:hypothetical protein